jgi:uncharacterized protein DUF882
MPAIRSVVALAVLCAPAIAIAAPRLEAKPRPGSPSALAAGAPKFARGRGAHPRQARAKKEEKPRECVKAPVAIVAPSDSATFSLAKCDGSAAPLGVERLSTLAGAPGGHRLDARLVERLELVVDHFRKGTEPARVVLVSGYRPRSAGSYHSTGRALDFRVEGVQNETLIAFCKTLPDTGCGYYPNSLFVHIDVRDPLTGHVTWTDLSRPGEAPRYVRNEATGSEPALPPLPGSRAGATGEDPKSMKGAPAGSGQDQARPVAEAPLASPRRGPLPTDDAPHSL